MAARDEQRVATDGGQSGRIELNESERYDRLRLIRSKNVGPATFQDLIGHFGCASQALEALPELSTKGGGRSGPILASQSEIDAELAQAERLGARLVALGERGYPRWLQAIDAPPPLLYVKGVLEIADKPAIAIVGARNGSAVGCKFARMLASDLGAADQIIVSGLARGIDTAAHKAALKTGTIAVLAGGLGSIYPPENEALQNEIGATGLLVSERPPALSPKAKDFPRRNRLISGIAVATVVVEAAKRSGSLITARLAGEQGREVFAVPGHPLDPRAAGTNRLLQDGAGLVTSADDVLSCLSPILGTHHAPIDDADDPAPLHPEPGAADISASVRDQVQAALGSAPIDIDEVIRATRLPARDVQAVLLELDLAGRLERHGQQMVSIKEQG